MDTPVKKRLKEYKQPYVGTSEFAAILGISRWALSARKGRNKLPEPAAELAMGPVWAFLDVVKFCHKEGLL